VSALCFAGPWLEHHNPFVTGAVTGGTGYPGDSYSFLSISDPMVLLWALKPAEDGIDQGVVARAWNLGSAASSFTLSLAPPS
jgi:alpha-mannosidase